MGTALLNLSCKPIIYEHIDTVFVCKNVNVEQLLMSMPIVCML